ncbi:MAG: HlyC/CorC family transporter [Oscillospiraceae bacterium]|nr:HlyC/CorC family transporter [Oscillospiraceae bacterium]
MDSQSYGYIITLFVCIMLSSFFSASETAFSAANKMRLRTAALDGDRRAARALKIAEDYDRTISVILIGNNIVNIAASSIATVAATKWFGISGPAIATVAMTIIVLTFGEILPKSFAKEHADKVVPAFAGSLSIAIAILTPIAAFFVKLQALMLKLTGSGDSPQVTEEELRTIIETSEEEGIIDEQRSELMRSALQFDDTTVQEVLTPRVDLVAIDIDDDPEEIKETILRERFSRLPVYKNDIDNIIGILQTRDYLEALLSNSDISLQEMLIKPLYAHKTQPIAALLSQFKRERRHMAVVVDDYGGTMGIVSMEDLLEELVGEIYDEDEVEEVDFVVLSDGEWRISGDYPIEDALERVGYLERGFESDYSSIGGWAFEMFGHIPEVGESFEYNGITVRIDEMDDQRIEWVVLSYKALSAEEE